MPEWKQKMSPLCHYLFVDGWMETGGKNRTKDSQGGAGLTRGRKTSQGGAYGPSMKVGSYDVKREYSNG